MTNHNPGGKSLIALKPGVIGHARFCGPSDCYRPWLSRYVGRPDGPYALWVGMNPSTARADVDDPTIAREWAYTTERLGLGRMIKVNVMDYRATFPKDLLAEGVEPCSDENLNTIRLMARGAARVIVAHGAIHKRLLPFAQRAVSAMRSEGVQLWCMGHTADGSPRHPLYMARSTELVPF